MKIRLDNKTALIGGASKGIGKSIADQIASSGGRCILMARDKEKLEQIAKKLEGERHEILQCDVTDHQSLEQKVRLLDVDIIINNTGGPPSGSLLDSSADDLQRAFDLHVKSSQIIARLLVPKMKQRNWGRIINIISTSVKQPINNLGVSNTIRGAMANWSKTLSNELAPFGITVNNILHGATQTDRLDEIISKKAKSLTISQEQAAHKMIKAIPAGRFAQPEEIAFTACFLSSEKAAYINGTNLVVDGGRTSSL
tara:strand:- start:934 stop:1698 length:765 start_codon:yes stop_codon:yes gene_type:complete